MEAMFAVMGGKVGQVETGQGELKCLFDYIFHIDIHKDSCYIDANGINTDGINLGEEVRATAKRIEGVTEKILARAKEEFLTNGYENASLRVIAEKAGYTKGVIYIRYPDKESLYRALVEPVVDGLCDFLQSALNGFQSLSGEEQKANEKDYADDGFPRFIAYIYEHFDIFKILLTSGETQIYQEFLHKLVEIDTACTTRFIEQTHNDAFSSGRLTPELAHILSCAFYSGVFEVVIHDMPQEKANEHVRRLRRFYNAGWRTIFEGEAAGR